MQPGYSRYEGVRMTIEGVVAQVLAEHTRIICRNVEAEWENMQGITGKAEMHSDLPVIIGNFVTATLDASGQKAWITEFGSGSKMDRESPYITAYLESEHFNQWRLHSSRMPIMGRSEGEYLDLDGNVQYSSGRMQGLDLERDGKARFQPFSPIHLIQRAIKLETPAIIIHIKTAVAEYMVQKLTMDILIYV